MSSTPEVNPYAPMKSAGEPETGEPRKPPRWLAVVISMLCTPWAGAGLLVLGRRRLAAGFTAVGLLGYLFYVLSFAHAVSSVAVVVILGAWLVGLIVTARARAGLFLGWARSIALLIGLLIISGVANEVIKAHVTEAFQIPSGAMVPTLLIGDHILVDKRARLPARGDVIVFGYPRDPSTTYIKRVVGLPGEQLTFSGGEVRVDGKPLPRRKLDEPCPEYLGSRPCSLFEERAGTRTYRIMHVRDEPSNAEPFSVPPDAVFVMGDNRDDSNDSRVWGALPLALIKGRARTVWFSRSPDTGMRWERSGIPIR